MDVYLKDQRNIEELIRSHIASKDVSSIYRLFTKSDLNQKKEILERLNHYDEEGIFVTVFQEALRTNHQGLFQFVIEKLDYPTKYFDQRAFNQMFLKALFLNLDITKIADYKKRKNKDLNKMIENYQEELELAGRALPAGIEIYFEG